MTEKISSLAVARADKAFYAEYPQLRGRKLTNRSEDAALRQAWFNKYRQAVAGVSNPDQPIFFPKISAETPKFSRSMQPCLPLAKLPMLNSNLNNFNFAHSEQKISGTGESVDISPDTILIKSVIDQTKTSTARTTPITTNQNEVLLKEKLKDFLPKAVVGILKYSVVNNAIDKWIKFGLTAPTAKMVAVQSANNSGVLPALNIAGAIVNPVISASKAVAEDDYTKKIEKSSKFFGVAAAAVAVSVALLFVPASAPVWVPLAVGFGVGLLATAAWKTFGGPLFKKTYQSDGDGGGGGGGW